MISIDFQTDIIVFHVHILTAGFIVIVQAQLHRHGLHSLNHLVSADPSVKGQTFYYQYQNQKRLSWKRHLQKKCVNLCVKVFGDNERYI